jgi:thiamine biosynthesis protein ThiS
VKIRLNGVERETAAENIRGLVAELGLPAQTALVEHNGEALRRDEWDAARLSEGDAIELLRVAAGG